MKSIRTQLLGWLLPGFVGVCAVAILGVYLSAKKAAETDLDARLARLAGSARLALRNQAAVGPLAARAPGMRAFLAKEEFQVPGQYFQLWDPEGAVVRRSPNLGTTDLPRVSELTQVAVRYDGLLPNGDPVRLSAIQVPQGGGKPPRVFVVALSRAESEARLSRLLTDLLLGGVACCVVLCLLLVLALRFALRPLARVGEQVSAMGTGSLHERFVVEALPGEIQAIVARLNDLMSRLEEGFERERRFSGYLAHELRTPLAAIRSTSEVALKWPEQAAPEDHAEIARLAARLQQTVDGLLVLARAEDLSSEIVCEEVALRPLLEECLALHANRAREREVTLIPHLDDGAVLQTDVRLLRIIVTNLVANAVEYAPSGSEVNISCRSADPRLTVTNAAPSLRAEDVPRLFERLWRKDAARSDAVHAGLGLSLAQSCAQALGLVLTAQLDGHGWLSVSLAVQHR